MSGAAKAGLDEAEIDAREAAVIGSGQRVKPLSAEALTDTNKDLSGMIRSVFGVTDNSQIPDIFATMARTPGLYRCQLELGKELVLHGAIPPRERELAILRCGWLCRAPFEWGEHVQFGKSCGVTDAEIEQVIRGSFDPAWNAHDRAIVAAVEQLIGDQSIDDATWETLAQSWSDEQLMELPVLVGHYFLTALLHNSLRIGLLDGNRGLRHR
jgi:4-carboxymuconolactone decarboxylase